MTTEGRCQNRGPWLGMGVCAQGRTAFPCVVPDAKLKSRSPTPRSKIRLCKIGFTTNHLCSTQVYSSDAI